jgi:cycloeucalenol cycloisomerase
VYRGRVNDRGRGQWWSSDPSKAAAERFYLLYSPIWIALMGIVMLTGMYRSWGDVGFMLLGLGVAAPLVLVPYLTPNAAEARKPAWDTTWFRFNVWIAIFVFVGSYFFTHYFFDVVGMRYAFPTGWNLEAELVGDSERTVPLFLYPLTQAYFMTYHVGATVLYRWLGTRFALGRAGKIAVIAVLAYVVAFAETFFMAVPALADVFEYADRGRMLLWGSMFYGSFFVISIPVFAEIDERKPWTLGQTVMSALGVSMAVFIVLDVWAKAIGTI